MKKKSYRLEQFPKNRDIKELSDEQIALRARSTTVTTESNRVCKTCWRSQPITEFYIKSPTGRRATTCRDCQMKKAGVKEIGKQQYAEKILKKGFRRCSICKDTKPLNAFTKLKNGYAGYANSCYECSHKHVQNYQKKQREEIGLFFIKQYGKSMYSITDFTPELIEQLRAEIVELRKPKFAFVVDGREFLTKESFADYIAQTYQVSKCAVIARLANGYSIEDCKLSEHDARSRAYTKGRIQVTDTITNEVRFFSSTNDPDLVALFSKSTIIRCLKTGDKTRVTSLSKLKNPCRIERIDYNLEA